MAVEEDKQYTALEKGKTEMLELEQSREQRRRGKKQQQKRVRRYILSLLSIPVETVWLVCICTLVSPTLSGEQATAGMWAAGALLCVTAYLNCKGEGREKS